MKKTNLPHESSQFKYMQCKQEGCLYFAGIHGGARACPHPRPAAARHLLHCRSLHAHGRLSDVLRRGAGGAVAVAVAPSRKIGFLEKCIFSIIAREKNKIKSAKKLSDSTGSIYTSNLNSKGARIRH